jgi:hypothetical protein
MHQPGCSPRFQSPRFPEFGIRIDDTWMFYQVEGPFVTAFGEFSNEVSPLVKEAGCAFVQPGRARRSRSAAAPVRARSRFRPLRPPRSASSIRPDGTSTGQIEFGAATALRNAAFLALLSTS